MGYEQNGTSYQFADQEVSVASKLERRSSPVLIEMVGSGSVRRESSHCRGRPRVLEQTGEEGRVDQELDMYGGSGEQQ